MESNPTEMTLDELRLPLAGALRGHVPFDGWTRTALDAAAADLGIPRERARLVFPGGATDMVDAHSALSDREMVDALEAMAIGSYRMRERIALAVRTRLELLERHRDTVARGLAVLAMPQNLPLSARLLWRTADCMWRTVGDTATGFDHYTKRVSLGAVYSATLLAWLADESEGRAETWSFLDRRIAEVMQVERLKARARQRERFDLTRFLGRLRYPAG